LRNRAGNIRPRAKIADGPHPGSDQYVLPGRANDEGQDRELAEPIPGVVLVHGAYGSSWPAMIQCLQGAGLAVIAGQNPLTSLAGTPRVTRRILALRPGPVILVEREG
jgi:hypothetical protein